MVEENSKQLRAHRKVDYFEEFSDGDQDDYEDEVKEGGFRLPVKRNRSKKRKFLNEVHDSNSNVKSNDNNDSKANANSNLISNGDSISQPKEIFFNPHAKKNKTKSDKQNKREKDKDKEKDKGHIDISESIIALSELNNQSSVTNCDIMLCLLELCLNSEKYGITLNNSSRSFWESISQNTELFHSLKQFKAETLRKYWRRMRLTFKYKKLIDAIKSNQQKLNHEDLKLLSAINAVCDYIMSPSKGLDAYISKYSIKKMKKVLLPEGPKNKNETDNEEDSQENITNIYHLDAIKEMVELLSKCYPNLLKATLYQKLIEVSGNVENAYLYIKNPEHYGYFAFTKEEDEVIKTNNESSDQYIALLKKKGYDLIHQRKLFLFN